MSKSTNMEPEKTYTIELSDQELEDIWSALNRFVTNSPDYGAVETKKAMRRIIKKIRMVMTAG